MPSGPGHTSGRICILSHSTTIRIKFFEVTSEPSILKSIEDETIDNIVSMKDLRQHLSAHLRRPANVESNSDAFKEWASKIVKAEFPSPLLGTGLELIDVPGFSIADHASLITIRKQFFNVYQPSGTLFCYANSAFSDGEMMAIPDLINSLPKGWNLESDSIFFVNTKVSKSQIAIINNIDPGDEVPFHLINNHTAHCFEKLVASNQKKKNISRFIDQRRFAVANSLAFIKQPKSPENRYIFTQFIDRLTKWIIKDQLSKNVWSLAKIGSDLDVMSSRKKYLFAKLDNFLADLDSQMYDVCENITLSIFGILASVPKLLKKLISSTSQQDSLHIDHTNGNITFMRVDLLDQMLTDIDDRVAKEIGHCFSNFTREDSVSSSKRYIKKMVVDIKALSIS
ncbi:hypothetical protein SAMD00019534_114550 [Acytostelium subglobosum LB1]|uniref:hypothetical protein n=1 Tax=Acytostelium subglobosum LB1 TaxID=1410327 RepID=UPI000644D09D|nr:hypothetical protein SAMD00019534_114550 [Acytostelium subglobosum LB1]GAM28279.1 hypothetical protein SAMD00019534_114550 [Acytostelium subglobosum LB1]|eukprot:XP_012748913.1 hypothetical protein SAMD00019534_114550 [Acytostelium subglobosum LB1]